MTFDGVWLAFPLISLNLFYCSTIQSTSFPSEVITYDQWAQQKPEAKSMFSGWIKGAFRVGKKEMQESIKKNLNFILSTAPMWDRFVNIYALKDRCFSQSFFPTVKDSCFRCLDICMEKAWKSPKFCRERCNYILRLNDLLI